MSTHTALGTCVSALGSRSPHWTQLKRNTDEVVVNSVNTVSAGSGYLKGWNTNGISFLSDNKSERIRQTGYLTKIALPQVQNANTVLNFELMIWRLDGSTFDKIATINLMPVSDGLNVFTLTTPLLVQEGDFYGFRLRGNNSATVLASSSVNSIRYTLNITGDTDYDWRALPADGHLNVTHLYMQAPLIACIGDSIMAGGTTNASFIDLDTNAVVNIPFTWEYKANVLDSRFVYQNTGKWGNKTADILARFDTHCVNLKPRIAVINGGINDLSTGVTKATFLANWTSILDKCEVASIIPFVWSICPWSASNTTQARAIDEWNADLKALAATYTGAKFIEWKNLLGEFRVGGDAGNLWNLKAAYNLGDNVHLTEAANAVIAAEVIRVCKSI